LPRGRFAVKGEKKAKKGNQSKSLHYKGRPPGAIYNNQVNRVFEKPDLVKIQGWSGRRGVAGDERLD